MNILVIGNGFDLAHQLPTRYSDFLGFANAFKTGDNIVFASFIDEIKNNRCELCAEIEGLIENNMLLNHFLEIYLERCKAGRDGWIDFERELSTIVQNLDKAKQCVERKYLSSGEAVLLDKTDVLNLEWMISDIRTHHFTPLFFDYKADQIYEEMKRLTRLLEIYLHEYVQSKPRESMLPDIKDLKTKIDHVLSFNYTDTYREYYDPDGNAKYCFIHGKAKESNIETCNLVLGIDEYLSSDRKDDDNQFPWFKKFFQRIYKETGSEYIDWINAVKISKEALKKAKLPPTNIYIYGHSLDVTDKDVLVDLILMENSVTHIFYHERGEMAKQITNLIKVIGEDKLIEKTGGKERTLRFIQSKEAVALEEIQP